MFNESIASRFFFSPVHTQETSQEEPLHWGQVTPQQREQGLKDQQQLQSAHGGPDVLLAVHSIKVETLYQSLRRRKRQYPRVSCYSLERLAYVRGSFGSKPSFRGFDGEKPWMKDLRESLPIKLKLPTLVQARFYWAQEILVFLREAMPMARLGREVWEDEVCIKLRVYHPDSGASLADLWASERLWHIRKITWFPAPGDKRSDTLHYEDYRLVGGLWLPHQWARRENPAMKENVIRIELNPELPNDFFKPWETILLEAAVPPCTNKE